MDSVDYMNKSFVNTHLVGLDHRLILLHDH